jgi:predicted nucleic acid-binding protein
VNRARPSAVLDACVLVPAALRDTLLRALQAELYRGYWSDEILREVERTLANGFTTAQRARTLVERIHAAFPEATVSVQRYRRLVPAMTNHPKDRHVLAAAIAVGARTIVTSNLRDFPQRSLGPHAIEAVSPDAFLVALCAEHATDLAAIIRRQAAALVRPPMSPERVLENLAEQVPSFAARLRRELRLS